MSDKELTGLWTAEDPFGIGSVTRIVIAQPEERGIFQSEFFLWVWEVTGKKRTRALRTVVEAKIPDADIVAEGITITQKDAFNETFRFGQGRLCHLQFQKFEEDGRTDASVLKSLELAELKDQQLKQWLFLRRREGKIDENLLNQTQALTFSAWFRDLLKTLKRVPPMPPREPDQYLG
jgi:hypothetical protein